MASGLRTYPDVGKLSRCHFCDSGPRKIIVYSRLSTLLCLYFKFCFHLVHGVGVWQIQTSKTLGQMNHVDHAF